MISATNSANFKIRKNCTSLWTTRANPATRITTHYSLRLDWTATMETSMELINRGSIVSCTTCFNQTIEGGVMAFDPTTKMLILSILFDKRVWIARNSLHCSPIGCRAAGDDDDDNNNNNNNKPSSSRNELTAEQNTG